MTRHDLEIKETGISLDPGRPYFDSTDFKKEIIGAERTGVRTLCTHDLVACLLTRHSQNSQKDSQQPSRYCAITRRCRTL